MASAAGPAVIDVSRFASESFDPSKYVNQVLASQNEEGVRNFRKALVESKQDAATRLKKNVFQNYTEFVVISKEISKLEGDMLSFKSLLNDLRELSDGIKMIGPASEMADIFAKDTDNNVAESQQYVQAASVATSSKLMMDAYGKHYNTIEDLVRARSKQMASLYESIDGLIKFLPDGRGRYLVRDGSKHRIFEINPSTLKQKQQILSFYLLNDTVIFTSKKKNLISGKNKVVVEKCFGLTEIAIIDVKDGDVTNAFKIMKHPDSYLFRYEQLEEKRSFLMLVKRATDDLLASRKKDKPRTTNPTEEQNRISADTQKQQVLSTTLATKDEKGGESRRPSNATKLNSKRIEDLLTSSQLKWLDELPDELDVLIAHRDFEVAVTMGEKSRKLLASVSHSSDNQRLTLVKQNIEDRINKISNLISLDLANPVSTKKAVQANIDRLLRLGLGEQARDIFLTARTMTIQHRIRQLKFDGDICSYISDLSEIVFKLIRNTCDWYGGSFRETYMASGFMKWVRGEIESYGEVFRRQVFKTKQGFSTISKCLEFTMHYCTQLKDVGLDLSFVLDKLFFADIVQAIEEHASFLNDIIHGFLDAEKFGRCSPPSDHVHQWKADFGDTRYVLTLSVYKFHKLLNDFGNDMSLVISIPLYGKIVACLKRFFSTYMARLLELFDKEWTNHQYFAMLVNGCFVVEELIPRIAAQLAAIRFDRPIPELEEHRLKLKGVVQAMHNSFIRLSTAKLISRDYPFPSVDYSSSASLLETAKPSDHIMKLLKELNSLCLQMDSTLDKKNVMMKIIQRLFEFMTEERCWETERGPRRFGFGGVQQLVLDIHFFLRVTDLFISDETSDAANSICERALRAYFAQNKNMNVPLKTGDWYDERVESYISVHFATFNGLMPNEDD